MSDLSSQRGAPQPSGAPQAPGAAGGAAPQAPLSEADIRAIADRVYELMLADLKVECERRAVQRQ